KRRFALDAVDVDRGPLRVLDEQAIGDELAPVDVYAIALRTAAEHDVFELDARSRRTRGAKERQRAEAVVFEQRAFDQDDGGFFDVERVGAARRAGEHRIGDGDARARIARMKREVVA